MGNRFLTFAAISGFFCVAFGAFTAHGLEPHLTFLQLDWIEKGLKYQFFHTLALLGLGLFVTATQHQPAPACRRKGLNWIGYGWAVGILCFSFSLYGLALTGIKTLAWFTPIGGVAFLIGWGALTFISIAGSLKTRD
ncbi:hypothetical protein A1D23_08560 [Chelonobacter oris]|uniref:Membrane protein n=1 Tax=Chelonobacter oris TaxID=505317 RepID=A0A0A3APA3_9PAST|nr:DUF423 domain-containing protein [Chelonobacter oris]KGQ71228.1 membrane protein [Chelonobacter oris]MDH3000229.1 hypothetical protein [Chelonobacter oris]